MKGKNYEQKFSKKNYFKSVEQPRLDGGTERDIEQRWS